MSNQTISSKVNSISITEPDSFEDSLLELAESGLLAAAAQEAIAASFALGLSVTVKDGDQVIRRFPDGSQKILSESATPEYTLPPGIKTIVNR